MKRFLPLLLVFLLVFSFSVTASAETLPLVTDTAGAFSSEEAEELLELATEISDKHDMDCAIIVIDSVSYYGNYSIQYASDSFFENGGLGRGDSRDGILLTIAVKDRDYAITTTGFAIAAFTDYGLERMEGDFISDFRDNDWFGGCKAYLEDCDYFLNAYESGSAIDVPEVSSSSDPLIKEKIGTGIVFGLIAGFLLSGIPLISKKKELKNAVGDGNAQRYLDASSFRLTSSNDQYITTNVIRTPIPRDDSSRGGGSMGGHGGSTIHMGPSGMSHGGRSGHF